MGEEKESCVAAARMFRKKNKFAIKILALG